MTFRDLASKVGYEVADYTFGTGLRRYNIQFASTVSELVTGPGEYKGMQIDLAPSVSANRRKDGNAQVVLQNLLNGAALYSGAMFFTDYEGIAGLCLGLSLSMKTLFYIAGKLRIRESEILRREIIESHRRGDLDDPEEREEILF